MSDVSEHNEKVLRKAERLQRIHELWKAIPGTTDEMAIAASATLAERFDWTGSVLNLDGKPATAEAVREHFGTNYGFLFPPKLENADVPKVDPQLLASARAGNMTAKSRLFVQVGRDQAKLAAVLADKSNTGADDTARDEKGRFVGATPQEKEAAKSNPWTAENWNVSRQGQIVRQLGIEAATRISRNAGSYPGATRPAKVA
jgi:hypothetical protein